MHYAEGVAPGYDSVKDHKDIWGQGWGGILVGLEGIGHLPLDEVEKGEAVLEVEGAYMGVVVDGDQMDPVVEIDEGGVEIQGRGVGGAVETLEGASEAWGC